MIARSSLRISLSSHSRSAFDAASPLALFVLIGSFLPLVAGAEYQHVPGTSISLDVPDGFVYSQPLKGYYREDASSVIRVIQSAAPYRNLSGKTNRTTMADSGVEYQGEEAARVSGMEARLISATLEKDERKYRRWTLVFGDESRSALVIAVYPDNASEVLADPLRDTLLTASWNRDLQSGDFEGLSFRVTETPVMMVATRLPSGLVMTDGGSIDDITFDAPILLVNEVAAVVKEENLETYAMKRTAGAESTSMLENVEGKKLTIDGLPAYEYEADLRMMSTGAVVRHYRAVVLADDATFVFQGTVGPARAPEYIPQFRDIAHSLTRQSSASE